MSIGAFAPAFRALRGRYPTSSPAASRWVTVTGPRPHCVPANDAEIRYQWLEQDHWRHRIVAETVSFRRVTARRAVPAGLYGGRSARRGAERARTEPTRASTVVSQTSARCDRLPVWPISHSGQAGRSHAVATMAAVGPESQTLKSSSFGDSSSGSMDAPVQRAP